MNRVQVAEIEASDTHQDRVFNEKIDLDAKLGKLDAFIGTEKYDSLTQVEKSLLTRQANVMREYSEILTLRTATFA
jgi:hypothetical protein